MRIALDVKSSRVVKHSIAKFSFLTRVALLTTLMWSADLKASDPYGDDAQAQSFGPKVVTDLPDEVLINMFQFVSPHDIVRASLVSKKLHTISNDLFLAIWAWNEENGLPPITTRPDDGITGLKIQSVLAHLHGLEIDEKTFVKKLITNCFYETKSLHKTYAFTAHRAQLFTDHISSRDVEDIIDTFNRLSIEQIMERGEAISAMRAKFYAQGLHFNYDPKRLDALFDYEFEGIEGLYKRTAEQIRTRGDAVFLNYFDFFRGNLTSRERSYIFKALFALSVDQINALADSSETYIKFKMSGEDRSSIINALHPLWVDEIRERGAAILANRASYFTYTMDEHDQSDIIKALIPLSAKQINALAPHGLNLVKFGLKGCDYSRILNALIPLSKDQIGMRAKAIMANDAKFFKGIVTSKDRSFIYESLFALSVDQIHALAESSKIYFREDMTSESRVNIIDEMKPLSAEQIKLSSEAIALNWDNLELETSDDNDLYCMLIYLPRLSVDQINAVARNFYKLMPFDYWERMFIVDVLNKLSVEQIDAIANCSESYFPEGMYGEDKSCIIRAAASLSVKEIYEKGPAIFDARAKLLTDDMSESDHGDIIKKLIALTVEQIYQRSEAIYVNRALFFTDDIDRYHQFRITRTLLDCSIEQIRIFASQSSKLFTNEMNADCKLSILKTLIPLTVEQVFQRSEAIYANQALFFTDDMDGHDQSGITRTLIKKTAEQINFIADALKNDPTDAVNKDLKREVIKVIDTHSKENFKIIQKFSVNLFTDDMNAADRIRCVNNVSSYPLKKMEAMNLIINHDLDGGLHHQLRDRLIYKLRYSSKEKNYEIFDCLKNARFDQMDLFDQRLLINDVESLSVKTVRESCDQKNSFKRKYLLDDLFSDDRARIIETLSQLPYHVQNCNKAITAHLRHYFNDINSLGAYITHRALYVTRKEQFRETGIAIGANRTNFFTDNMSELHKARIIEALVFLSTNQIRERGAAIAANREKFFTALMTPRGRCLLVSALVKLSVEQIHALSDDDVQAFTFDVFAYGKAGPVLDDGRYVRIK